MKPFYDSLPSGLTPDGKPWSAIVYYNDVYLSGTHFLELLHQHFMQDADMTCGWDHAGRWFYDGWVGRDMSGDLYTPFPVKEEDKDLPQKVCGSRLIEALKWDIFSFIDQNHSSKFSVQNRRARMNQSDEKDPN